MPGNFGLAFWEKRWPHKFCPFSWIFSIFLKIGQSLISGLDKKNQKSGQHINFPVSETGHFFGQTKKNKKLTRQLVGSGTDQNNMDIP